MTDGQPRHADSAPCCAVVVNYRTPELAIRAAESLLAEGRAPSVLLLDGGSGDRSPERLASFAASHDAVDFVDLGANLGFGAACNRGIERALADRPDLDAVLLLNPDVVVEPGAVGHLLDYARAHPDAGIVGGRVLSGDGRRVLFENGLYRPWTLGRSHVPAPLGSEDLEVEFVTGALMLIDAEMLREGLRFDERFFLYVEDLDLCREVRRRGRTLRLDLRAVVRHDEGASQASEAAELFGMRPRQLYYVTRNKVLFARKWLSGPQRLCYLVVAGVLKPMAGVLTGRGGLRALRAYWRAYRAGLRGESGPVATP